MRDFNDFSSIQIKLASPDMIRDWSYGEVKKPETINYRTLKPERDGLFCERTFGTTKEWECYCGKFKSIRYKGVVCDRCGVEVTHYKVRRERGGHIELAAPVAHIWYYRSVPSRMGLLLDITVNNLKSVLYYEKYIVIDPGDAEADDVKRGDIIDEDAYYDHYEKYGDTFVASMGAEAIKDMLVNIDLDEESRALRAEIDMKSAKDAKIDKKLIKRLEIIEAFKESGNKPDWMILDVVPVIPPELRPMVQLDGGRFATSDLNDLYRRVINRNNRLKRLLMLRAPEIIVRNEKRMLQEAVDALFDNSRRKRAVKGKGNRPLKSLSDMLKGKQGRFRQNLLGKRVDYSGRSVIVVGPELKLHQCGLPKKMAIELFKPFIMKRLVDKDFVQNIKSAKKMVENERDEVWEVLEEVIKEHPVLLNRAPTLHRLGIQAFEPTLVEGKAIKLHPLVCHAYNADFDGDQMAVHVPLSPRAQLECWTLMLSTNNLLSPANGHPTATPSQDIVLGIYYLTDMIAGSEGEDKYFDDFNDVIRSIEHKQIRYRTRINYLMGDNFVSTTAGRLIFNRLLPEGYPFVNNVITDKGLSKIIADVFRNYGPNITVKMLDDIKETGYKYATNFAPTISISDIIVPESKKAIIDDEDKKVESIENEYRNGFITDEERYNRVINLWTEANEKIANEMFRELETNMDGHNPIWIMAKSGARGSRQQIRQLAGMRGLMAKPSGEIIEVPIRANFKEGLTVLEYFISTNGARKGLADTALKTADAGYLTRRLVDIAQDVVITNEDCGTTVGIDIYPIKEGDTVIESLGARVLGRTLLYDLINPVTGETIAKADDVIDEEIADLIDKIEIDSIEIRSVLTCESKHGVCAKCYGRNLATSRPVEIGEAVGIIAAQSIGQPGTQLTMRTFHIGGIASRSVEESEIKFNYPIFIKEITSKMIQTEEEKIITVRRGYIIVQRIISETELKSKTELLMNDGDKIYAGKVFAKVSDEEEYKASNTGILKIDKKKAYILGDPYSIPVNVGTEVIAELDFDKKNGLFRVVQKPYAANEIIASFDPWFEPILTEITGRVEFVDVELNKSLIEEIDPVSNVKKRVIVEYKTEKLQPRVNIFGAGNEPTTYLLPKGANLMVDHGSTVNAGVVLAKIPRGAEKTKDITGGLPRVAELFEARTPKDAATLTAIDGTVTIGDTAKNKRKIIITAEDGSQKEYSIPVSKFLRVQDKDWITKGEKIDDGPVDPHEILRIKGPRELQKFLVNEIQEVYRLQGVAINDKHIETIVRQMLRKVRVTDQGDSNFVIEQVVDKFDFIEENDRVLNEGGKPATAIPVLMGITKAALNTESFISAASFQETTRVLTDAAIKGKVDHLRGLKENVIIGHLIPAGTGVRIYNNISVYQNEPGDLDGVAPEAIDAEGIQENPELTAADLDSAEK
ncbi:MAG TPA: DNA-directed RNA polymerase subunit beta' [Spirochaetota bacterium]|nr:DNA-directed RNA polymerase subunit beta' [Spirochaetota bacterium]HPF04757.1 DNA-directed RNA polymerase subunit beta' [Spirochaetota bacterium]HPJ41126.1 DNA-directed RNA polymerase subunit beta' [Spirochaetota bacterium]HRX46832.1 DNA-directed RNA polymerase subunit beta' [Spirochaetota bacterium]